MYSDEVKKENNVIEIDIHPVSKWRRILLFLGDFFIHFMLGVLIMSVVVVPIASIFVRTDNVKAYEAEKRRDDVLYEYKLLFYKSIENTGGKYQRYDFDSDLVYTCNRFLAYYTFSDSASLDPDYPEYSHLEENEIIKTYYVTIRSDSVTYYDLFTKLNKDKDLFVIEGNNISLKQEVIDEVRVFFKPGESLGPKGQGYYDSFKDFFSAIFGVVIQDIYNKDLVDSKGNSFVQNQQIITYISNRYYSVIAICASIAYVLSWALVYVLYPLINRGNRTPTGSIMKIDRLAFKHLTQLNKGETFITSFYSLFLNLPFIMFLPLSYTTFIYSLKIPVLPILSIIVAFVLLVDLFIILFNSFDRSIIDLLSQTVMVSSDEVDGIIKAKESIKELEIAKKKGTIKDE